MFFSNLALEYVSFPTQALAKAAKPIFVMLISTVVLRRRYPLRKYITILMITGGVAAFMISHKSRKAGERPRDTSNDLFPFVGEVCLLVSLVLDGFTGPLQDRLKQSFRPSSYQMMMLSNIYHIGYLLILGAVADVHFCRIYGGFN